MNKNQDKVFNKTSINWYPGHMAKTKRLIKDNLKLIDVVYEVIDSRIPYSSKVKDIDDIIKSKPVVLIMTKYDLCDKNETNRFIRYYEQLGYKVLSYDLNNNNSYDSLFNLSRSMLTEKHQKLNENGSFRKAIRALVIGIPNVGKSTLINRLTGKKTVITGNMPGVTKSISWINARNDILLLDSPGILWPKLDQEKIAYNLATTTAIKEEILEKDDIVYYIMNFLLKYYPNILNDLYGITEKIDFEEMLLIIGKKRGFLLKGGEVDYEKVYSSVFNDIKSGRIKNITLDRFSDVK